MDGRHTRERNNDHANANRESGAEAFTVWILLRVWCVWMVHAVKFRGNDIPVNSLASLCYTPHTGHALKPLILFGLGNPGDEYRNTRHNMGENAVRAWAVRAGLDFESGDGPFLQTPVRRGVRAVIPTTYMNLVGKAVTRLKAQLEFGPKEFLVVADDVWLSLGRLRLRKDGSDGGHNGLKSVAEALDTQGYPRLRMGVGPIPEHADWADFVLDPFDAAESEAVEAAINDTVDALGLILARGYSAAQNTINRTPDEGDDEDEKTAEK